MKHSLAPLWLFTLSWFSTVCVVGPFCMPPCVDRLTRIFRYRGVPMMHRLYCASESCKCIDGVFATLAVPIYESTTVSYRVRSLHLFYVLSPRDSSLRRSLTSSIKVQDSCVAFNGQDSRESRSQLETRYAEVWPAKRMPPWTTRCTTLSPHRSSRPTTSLGQLWRNASRRPLKNSLEL